MWLSRPCSEAVSADVWPDFGSFPLYNPGCSLTSLEDESGSCPLAGLTRLETLHLGANDLEEAEDLAPLKELTSVRELFLEDNPCAEMHSCKAQVLR